MSNLFSGVTPFAMPVEYPPDPVLTDKRKTPCIYCILCHKVYLLRMYKHTRVMNTFMLYVIAKYSY